MMIGAAAVALMSGEAMAHGKGGDHLMGTVKSIDDTSLTIETGETNPVTVATDDKTKFQNGGAAAALKDLKVGDRVVVHAVKKDAGLVAQLVKFGATPKKSSPAPGHEDHHESGPAKSH